jgi:acetate---CoA ligase (ADP-forming)
MSLKTLFYPKSVALIGASTREGSVGNEIAKNLVTQRYAGKLYLVNPKGGKLFGKTVHPDLKKIPVGLDLAIIAIPAVAVIDEVKRLVDRKVKAIVVISAGFSEAGNDAGEKELVNVCKQHDITLIGPNCLGILNPELKLNASFAPLMPEVGSIAFVSQSGAICASVLDYARREKLGFSKFVSVGNKAAVGEVEILEYLYHDTQTKIIALYVEELEHIEELRKTVVKITHGQPHKPIIVLKSGRTDQGRQAALSHTGSLGGSDKAYEALFAQTGMIRAETIDELFDFIECFARNRVLRDDRVAIITNAGGPGVLTADALVSDGLKLAQLSDATQIKLKTFLPPAANVKNPVDILGDAPAERYKRALEVVLDDPGVDAVQIILTPQSMTEVEATAKDIVALRKHSRKALEVTFMGQGLVQSGVDILNKNQIATSYFPESASKALAALFNFNTWLQPRRSRVSHFENINSNVVEKILDGYSDKEQQLVTMGDAFRILSAYGLPVVKRWTVTSEKEARELAQQATQPLALKIISPDISHKTEVGGVVLDVKPADLPKAYMQLVAHIGHVQPKADIQGVEVMPMITDAGVEVILGVTTDQRLGKQILVGLGGIYAEILQDTSWGLAPLTATDIERMMAHLKVTKIMSGLRGQPPLAIDAVTECLGRLSKLVTDFPAIQEIDINPLKVLESSKGALILDARMVVA